MSSDDLYAECCRLTADEKKPLAAAQSERTLFDDGEALATEAPVAAKKTRRRAAKPAFSWDEMRRQAEKDARLMEMRGIGYVSVAENGYPALLQEIYDPPPVLFYRGSLACVGGFAAAADVSAPANASGVCACANSKGTRSACAPAAPGLPRKPEAQMRSICAIVGTRKAAPAALRLCYEIARQLGEAGVSVISGLALGIDAMAHRGNLDGGAATAAVFGCSLDYVYPPSNRNLARRLLERGGVLLSEYPPETPPAQWTFPARNRIIAGLCRFTLVVEAGKKSGALITADFALEQGRELGVAADENGAAFGEGCEKLTFDGAKKIHSALDIMRELGLQEPPEKSDGEKEELTLAGSLARELGL
jgi:DNA processing protein